MTRVGIPRALSYYRYFPLWETFLEECGVEIVRSDPTNKLILEKGVSHSVDDICLPVKCYFGHVLDLNEKADYILVERILSPERNLENGFTCPKLMALLDMVKHGLEIKPKILEFCLDSRKHPLTRAIGRIAKSLGIPKRRALNSMKAAIERQKLYESKLTRMDVSIEKRNCQSGKNEEIPLTAQASDLFPRQEDARSEMRKPCAKVTSHPYCQPKRDLKIAVVGHEYLIFDKFLSHDICGKLERLGATVYTSSALPEEIIEKEIMKYEDISWVYERDLVGAASYFLSSGIVDGVIFVVCFACGPDSITMEIINREICPKNRPPVMTIVIDEHTGDAGVLTRLEAFCDMVRRG